jgi:two-component system sensor histidine kinase KdpD
MLSRLIRDSGNIDVHCVRAEGEELPPRRATPPRWQVNDARGYAVAAGVAAGVTAVNFILQRWVGDDPLSLIYLLSVVGLGMFVGRGPTLAAATLTALLWNFFFTEPRLTFRITRATDTMMFDLFCGRAGHGDTWPPGSRRNKPPNAGARGRATALYLLTRELAEAKVCGTAGRDHPPVGTVFKADVARALAGQTERRVVPYPFGTLDVSEKEASVAWAFHMRNRPGTHGYSPWPRHSTCHW